MLRVYIYVAWLLGDRKRFIVQKRPIATTVPLFGNSLIREAITMRRQGAKQQKTAQWEYMSTFVRLS